MKQGQALGVQQQARRGRDQLSGSIEAVAEDGVSERQTMHPELVAATGLGVQLQGQLSSEMVPSGTASVDARRAVSRRPDRTYDLRWQRHGGPDVAAHRVTDKPIEEIIRYIDQEW